MGFRVSAAPEAHACRLVLSGDIDIDAAADVIELGTTALTDTSISALVLDLAAVTFMDSTGLGALISLRNTAGHLDKPMTLEHVGARVQRLLYITGLAERLGVPVDVPAGEMTDV